MGAAFKYAREARKEVATSDFIPYTSHVSKAVLKLKGGDYCAVIRLQGAAHESADALDIDNWHTQLNSFLRNIASPHVAIWTHDVRREFRDFPEGDFPPGFAHDLNEKYRASMAEDRMLINELYLSIIYRPQPIKVTKLFDWFKSISPSEAQERQHDELERMNELVGAALSSLTRYEPDLLSTYDFNGNLFSEALEFLSFLIDGEWHRCPVPRAEICDVLATTRPLFGKGGLMSFKGPTRTQFGAILSITEYPANSCPGMLNELLAMPFEFVLSQSFTFLSKQVAIGRMKRQQGRMINAGDVAQSQIADLDRGLNDLVDNRYVMGVHHFSLAIRADHKKHLDENINDAGNALSDGGMKWGRDDAGMAGSFWAQLPGNFDYRVRISDITSLNFAGFTSFHNFPIGRIRGNQWGPAVTMFRTTSDSPYYFNYHGQDSDKNAKLDPNHKDLANTVFIGKSGVGKTALAMFLLAQTQKFAKFEEQFTGVKRLSCVLFDKDLGASIVVRALGGRYYTLKNGLPSGFNPFQMPDSPGTRSFLNLLITVLVKRDSMPLTPMQEREISEAVAGVMGAEKRKRRIGACLEFLGTHDENGIGMRLERWCGQNQNGWLFDNREDTLSLDDCSLVGFDVSEFLKNPETRTPTILYLFHRIESLIDGRRIPIFMEEFGQLLDDPSFEELSQNKLVTIRKQDGFLVMSTQNPKQVLQSPIAHAIIGQTATKIFLPNPEADFDDYVKGFKLTVREFEIIKGLGEKSRQFLIKQGENSVVAELNLRGYEDELAVLSGNTGTSLLVEKLVEELGNDPAVWLPAFHRIRKGIKV